MARIQKHVWLAFKVEGQRLKPEYTNPVLHKFYYMLNDFRIEKDVMKIVLNSKGERIWEKGKMAIVVTNKDPAVIQQVDSMWVKGSIHLDMEVIGYPSPEENVAIGLDHSTEVLILRGLKELKVDEGKYSKHVKIEVLEVTFSENYREHPDVWPVEPLFRTQV